MTRSSAPPAAARPGQLLDDLLAAIDAEVAPAEPVKPAAPAAPHASEQRFVLFRLGQQDFAVPLEHVLEISRPLPITPVPNTPDWLLGVANVRGDIISMVDLTTFFGLGSPEQSSRGRLIVARAADLVVGLIVAEVAGIRPVPRAATTLPSALLEGRVATYLQGVAPLGERLISLLDLERLLLSPDIRQFELV